MNNIIQTVGRRKCSTAQIKLVPGDGIITINGKLINDFLQGSPTLLNAVQKPLEQLALENKYNITVQVSGGGITGQANAIQLGIARALCVIDSTYRTILKPKGLLTRDSRIKERRKYGLKKARKAPQFSKR
jgi:small subunit ribosomal protein S9